EACADPPVVLDIAIVRRRPKILIRVAERDRTGVGYAQQKVGEIAARPRHSHSLDDGLCGRAGETEIAARILLREQIELDPPRIAADRDVVRALEPQHRIRNSAGLIAREALLPVAQRRKAAVERKAGRPP